MYNEPKKLFLIIILFCSFIFSDLLIFTPNGYANTQNQLTKILKLYKDQDYLEAANELKKIIGNSQTDDTVFYWLGLCYFNLKEFDDAIQYLELAKKKGANAEDLNYVLGQSYYAALIPKKARKNFGASAKKNYKRDTSLYYMGITSEDVKQFGLALKYYKKISKKDPEIYQAGQYQMGEAIFSQLKEGAQVRRGVRVYVIPQFEKARKFDVTSPIGKKIKSRIAELEEKYDLSPNKMINGRKIPDEYFQSKLTQSFAHDSNVITESDSAPSKAAFKDSGVLTTDIYFKYKHPYVRRFIVTPRLDVKFVRHTERESPQILLNDKYSINPSLKVQFEHKVKKEQASLIFDYSYDYTAKDVRQNKELHFYGRTHEYYIEEKFTYWPSVGESSIKLKRKNFIGQSESLDSYTNSLALSQTYNTPSKHLIMGLLSIDLLTVPLNTANSTNTYLLRFDYIISRLIENIKMGASFTFSLTDTKEQKASRGLEKMYNPTIDIERPIWKGIKAKIEYGYTKNVSKNVTTYSYQKHLYTLKLSYKFK